jgi:hypothetical protein
MVGKAQKSHGVRSKIEFFVQLGKIGLVEPH